MGWIIYGVFSGFYRVLVYGGIILFVANRFLIAGLLMAAVCIFSWGLVPAARFANYLSASPKLIKTRTRAVAISLTGVAILLFVFGR